MKRATTIMATVLCAFGLGVAATAWWPFNTESNRNVIISVDDSGSRLEYFYVDGERDTLFTTLVDVEIFTGERPGVAVVDRDGSRTVLLEPETARAGSHYVAFGELRADHVVVAISGDDGLPTDVYFGDRSAPLTPVPRPATDPLFSVSQPWIYVAGDQIFAYVADVGSGRTVLIDPLSGEVTTVASTSGYGLPPHRDLCADANGVDAFTVGWLSDPAGDVRGDTWVQRTFTFSGDEFTRTAVAVPDLDDLSIPATACGPDFAVPGSVNPGEPRSTLLATDGAAVVNDPATLGYVTGEVVLSPQWLVTFGVALQEDSKSGLSVMDRSTGRSTVIENQPCGPVVMRGDWLTYGTRDGASCVGHVVRVADAVRD